MTSTVADLETQLRQPDLDPTSPPAREAVSQWLRLTSPTNPFLHSVKLWNERRPLSDKQVAAVVKTVRGAQQPRPVAPITGRTPLADGYYTVAWPTGGHTTIRVQPHWLPDEAARGKQVVGYLSGSDNESSYSNFAGLDGASLHVWRKYTDKLPQPHSAVMHLLTLGAEGQRGAGEAYAVRSGRCRICGRMLTTPESIARHIGPECLKKVGA